MIYIPFIFVENIQIVDLPPLHTISMSGYKMRSRYKSFLKIKEDRINKISAIKWVLEKE